MFFHSYTPFFTLRLKLEPCVARCMACGFVGDADIYGIGIRIGYYAQTLAVWFANFFLLSEAKSLRAVNNLFLFALTVAGSMYAYNAPTTHAVEAFLLLQIFLCIGLVSIMDATRYNTRYIRRSEQRLLLRVIIINGGLVFNILFWWKGLDILKPTPCERQQSAQAGKIAEIPLPRYGTYACYLIRANLYSWMRTVMKSLSLVLFVWTGLITTSHDVGEFVQNLRLTRNHAVFVQAASCLGTKPATAKGSKHTPRSKIFAPLSQCLPFQRRARRTQPLNAKKDIRSYSTAAALFDEIRKAEVYLESLFLPEQQNQPDEKKKQGFQFLRGCIKLCTYKPNQPEVASVKYSSCLRALLKTAITNKPPVHLRWRVMLHMIALGKHQPWYWPRILHRMTELRELGQEPRWKLLAIASDVKLSQIPLHRSALIWAWMAVQSFIIIIFLIAQVELTIVWNNISGLKSLRSLGQLIPFILGVGGLIQVLWGKWRLVQKSVKENAVMEITDAGEYEAAIERYIQWRQDRSAKHNLCRLSEEQICSRPRANSV